MVTLDGLKIGARVAYCERQGYGTRYIWGTVTRIMPARGGAQLQDELEMLTDDSIGGRRVTFGGPIGQFKRA